MNVKSIYIINGPNLNLVGVREPEIYGAVTFEDFIPKLRDQFPDLQIHYFQSNHEGRLIDKIQEVGFESNTGIVLNAGGYTHTSIAIADAVAAITAPVAEVHISDVKNRETFRRHSYIKIHADYFISGKGLEGYSKAIMALISTTV